MEDNIAEHMICNIKHYLNDEKVPWQKNKWVITICFIYVWPKEKGI